MDFGILCVEPSASSSQLAVHMPVRAPDIPSDRYGMSESWCVLSSSTMLASTCVLLQCKLAAALAAMIECWHALAALIECRHACDVSVVGDFTITL